MIYNDFKGVRLSAVEFSAMRLPVIDEDDSRVDQIVVNTMVDYAMEYGVDYFDTTCGYHSGMSEVFIGNALGRQSRDSYYLADKDHFNLYLFHNVCEMNIDQYLDQQYGIMDYLLDQKWLGRIFHLEFYAHGSINIMERFIEARDKHMKFCQIQLNYVDWTFQDAKGKLELLKRHGIPC